MSYMRTVKVNISEKHPLYGYAQQLTALANNLSNAARFRQRQLMTAAKKEPADWTANEQEVMDELYAALPEAFNGRSLPGFNSVEVIPPPGPAESSGCQKEPACRKCIQTGQPFQTETPEPQISIII